MRPRPQPLALLYHGIARVPPAADPHGLFVRPVDLRRQLQRLRSWGYEFAQFGDWAQRVRAGDAAGYVTLTFDDGYVDNLETLVPILAEERATATVFVVSGWLGKATPYLPRARIVTDDELRRLRAAGVEIGAHTVSHPDLTSLSRAEATDELRRSKAHLEEILDEKVTVAAYPYGSANEDTIAACIDAGFAAACGTKEGVWSDPFNLPREGIDNYTTMVGLRLKRDGRYEPLMRHLLPRTARKVVRYGLRLWR